MARASPRPIRDGIFGLVERLGLPSVLLLALLSSIYPRLDRLQAVADHVESYLTVVATRCGPPT